MRIEDYSHRRIRQIATPLILSNVTVALLGIVDTAVVGHLDSPRYLAAVAVGAVLFDFIFYGFNFLRMGTTGVTAQALGEADQRGVQAALAQALLIGGGLGVLLIALHRPLLELALALMSPGAEVVPLTRDYYLIRIWAAPAALANFALLGWFIGQQNGRVPLILMLVVNIVNIVLDLLLVWVYHLDVRGVAIASVIAEYSGLLVGLLLAWRSIQAAGGPDWPLLRRKVLERRGLGRLFNINFSLFIRTLCLMFAFGYFTARGARLGQSILAANAVLLNLQYLMAYALDGFANAAEALIGRAIGEKQRQALKLAYRNTLQWSAGVALVIAGLYALTGKWLIYGLTDIESVREVALTYLPWLILSPIVSVWCFFYDGVFVGATRASEMRNTMALSTFFIFVPLVWLLQPLGNHGLWLAFLLFMLARGITLHWMWQRPALDAGGAGV